MTDSSPRAVSTADWGGNLQDTGACALICIKRHV